MSGVIKGWFRPRMSRDQEGYRTYKIKYLIRCGTLDGPAQIAGNTPGLPLFGTQWFINNDVDIWAFCRWEGEFAPYAYENEPGSWYTAEYTFSTRLQRKNQEPKYCSQDQIEDPLLIPPRLSGGAVKYTEEMGFDKDGNALRNSAFEKLRGPQVEFDRHRGQVKVETNLPSLNESLWDGLTDHVNTQTLWNKPARCVKFSNYTWERRYYGTCYQYYTVTFEFDWNTNLPLLNGLTIPGLGGFDRIVQDEGTQVLRGKLTGTPPNVVYELISSTAADPNPAKQSDFILWREAGFSGERVVLNRGLPALIDVKHKDGSITNDQPGGIQVQYYPAADLTQLGIPLSL